MSGRICPPLSRRALAGAVVAIATVLACLPAAPARADAVTYQQPVGAPVVEEFRPPSSPYGPGNRGVDFETGTGEPVAAAAEGVVAFAGQVGGSLHVTVLHPDGVRTTYSFLRSISAHRGARVAAGQELGRAAGRLHWGARAGDAYIDPRLLLGDRDGAVRAKLVPDGDRGSRPRSENDERALLAGLLRTVVRTGVAAVRAAPTAVSWARGQAVDRLLDHVGRMASHDPVLGTWVSTATHLSSSDWLEIARVLRQAGDARDPCTPAWLAPPSPSRRRVAVLVGGLGSSSASAAVTEVDTAALGYAPGDVQQFSYRGGTAADRPYSAGDTQGDLPEAGRRLRRLLDDTAAANPGVPVDVIAHSQGGVVARLALADGVPSGVASLVTLGSPHQGADIATAGVATRRVVEGRLVQDVVHGIGLSPLSGAAPAVAQLARGSAVLDDLNRRSPPAGLALVSVAARADVVVPPPRSRLPGGRNVTVTVHGLHHHSELPAAPEATREIALAIAGLPPTCRSARDAVLDAMAAQLIVVAEQGPVVDAVQRARRLLRLR